MDVEALISAALREAGYGPDAVGSALPRIMRILYAEDVRIAVGRSLWWDEIRDLLAGRRDRDAAVTAIAANFRHAVDVYIGG